MMGFAMLNPSDAQPILRSKQRRKLVGRAQHRVVARVELAPSGGELVGGAALMRLTRIDGPAAPDHRRRPLPFPEIVEPDRVFIDPDRMQGVALERAGPRLRLEIGKEPGFGVLARRTGG